MSEWIGTANQGYAPYAMEELRRLLPGSGFAPLSPGETFYMECGLEKEAVLEEIRSREPVFLRHIQPVDRKMDSGGDAGDLERLADAIRPARLLLTGKRTAVHIRRSPGSRFACTVADAKAVLDAVLVELEAEPCLQGPDMIVSIYAAGDKLYAGFAPPRDMLSDWPGGAVRFQREEGQISRAKFKLLEAEAAFGLQYASFRHALDIGAAPGGWTSLLLERGLRVTAVDPADMHPALGGHPAFVHLKQNAADVKLKDGDYDLLVCDMSWSPMLMCRLVLDLQRALVSGAKAVITVKLMHRKPLQTIREVKERLETAFVVLKAKQLFHNREEITLYAEKR